MKMTRSKRDRRPLLSDDVPILSDEMPLSEEVTASEAKNNQLNGSGKKKSWKKVFKSGSKKNLQQLAMNGGRDGSNSDRPAELSTNLPSPEKASKKSPSKEAKAKIKRKIASRQSSGVSDKRDDNVELSQTVSTSKKQVPATSVQKEASAPTPTKPQGFVRSRSKSRSFGRSRSKNRSFIRSLKKKNSARDIESPLGANSTAASEHTELDDIMNSMASPVSTERAGDSRKYDVKKILSKPFGREHILTTDQTFVVQASRAEWDPDDSLRKYRINIKKREGSGLRDFATSFTLRSLEDFAWLERSLQTEFFGGLLLPNLSIYLGLPDILSCQHEIDSQLLANWLSDTLNGIRGQGEVVFSVNNVDISISQSMEAFLYQSELFLPTVNVPKSTKSMATAKSQYAEANSKWNFFPELCYTNCLSPQQPETETKQFTYSPSANSRNTPTSNALIETVSFSDVSTNLTMHADLLRAERDLIWSWRTRALQAMEKLSILKEQEKYIGAAWKRFAISVSNLFAYEKDIETARLGDSKSRRDLQVPYRKLQKSAVDDVLRILIRHKLERSTPSIDAIYIMLSTYVADLSMVQPSVASYLKGLKQLAAEKSKSQTLENGQRNETNSRDPSETLADRLQAGLKVVTKQLASTIDDDWNGTESPNGEELRRSQRQQVQTIENRLLMNEALLKEYMTTLCKTAPVRTSRIIYAYLEKELEQCKALNSAAVDMKGKINVASKETLSKMIHRHHTETKEDKDTELKLVHKIVNIGNSRKFLKEIGDDHSQEVEKGVELSFEFAQQETSKMKRRDKAMNDCRSRIGRWDAKLAMAIMEAVGVSDANVRVEETTRDLRMVRKYAINLRENLERCNEGLEGLKMTILQGGMGDIRDIRADFMTEMKNLLSFTYVPVKDQASSLPSYLVEREGIDLSDPAGWNTNGRGSCGSALNSYIETRDSGTEWLLESLGELLKEYSNRVEAIESFVYMECVGIQLEKHFSQARAAALTAFEKKTDITSAINIATRKKMPVLVKELQGKLENLGPVVSHTTVKEAKEAHLESKTLKQELHTLAMRRLARARETSTERAIALMTVWAKEEEGSTSAEQTILEELNIFLTESLKADQLAFYVGASPARI